MRPAVGWSLSFPAKVDVTVVDGSFQRQHNTYIATRSSYVQRRSSDGHACKDAGFGHAACPSSRPCVQHRALPAMPDLQGTVRHLPGRPTASPRRHRNGASMIFDIYNLRMQRITWVDATDTLDALKHATRVHGRGASVEKRLTVQERLQKERAAEEEAWISTAEM